MAQQEKSALLETPEQKDPKYSTTDTEYYGRVLSRLLNAKINRDKIHPEFNNQTYAAWFDNNERLANTVIVRDKTNRDFAVNTGTVEQKLYAIVAEVNRLNLTGQVRAFDVNSEELQELGTAFTDVCDKTAEIEGDEENKLIRQVELLKQGTVFVQDNWVKEYKPNKVVDSKFKGSISSATWTTKLEKVFDGPKRQILYGKGVYLGNIREFDMKKQPFVFTHKVTSWQEAASRYGMKDAEGKAVWERWEAVPRDRVFLVTQDNISTYTSVGGGFALTDLMVDQVEEIHYQDYFNNEYQILLNGIAMLPVGFPLSAITPNGEYNIEKQVLQVINPFFAYGRSFVVKTQALADLLDEVFRLLVLKTRKSIHPPYANISGKVISERSLMPGAITMGLDPQSLVPIGKEGEGATSSEYQMLKELRDAIDRATVSPQQSGMQGKSGTTAYEVQLLQQQAQKIIALTLFACSMMEKKLTWLRLMHCLAYYFEPIGTKWDEARQDFVNVYRQTSTRTSLSNRGSGTRMIIPIDSKEGVTSDDVYKSEEYHGIDAPSQDEEGKLVPSYSRKDLGMEPIEKIYLDVGMLNNCKYLFHIEVEPKPKDTSNNAKLMFREELADIQAMVNLGSTPNVEELENTYSLVWNRKKGKMFGKAEPVPRPDIPAGGTQQVMPQASGASSIPQES